MDIRNFIKDSIGRALAKYKEQNPSGGGGDNTFTEVQGKGITLIKPDAFTGDQSWNCIINATTATYASTSTGYGKMGNPILVGYDADYLYFTQGLAEGYKKTFLVNAVNNASRIWFESDVSTSNLNDMFTFKPAEQFENPIQRTIGIPAYGHIMLHSAVSDWNNCLGWALHTSTELLLVRWSASRPSPNFRITSQFVIIGNPVNLSTPNSAAIVYTFSMPRSIVDIDVSKIDG